MSLVVSGEFIADDLVKFYVFVSSLQEKFITGALMVVSRKEKSTTQSSLGCKSVCVSFPLKCLSFFLQLYPSQR